MNLEAQQVMPEPPAETSSKQPELRPSRTERSGGNHTAIIVVAAAAALCLCGLLCFGVFGGLTGLAAIGASASESEIEPVESVLDAFMRAMAAKDIEAAHSLFSPRAQTEVRASDLQELIQGSNYGLFEGYQSVSIYDINVQFVTNPNPRMPQGRVAEVVATTSYDCGCQGRLEATLEKVDGTWQLDWVYVTVPPEMLQP